MRSFERILLKNWWVIVFVSMATGLYAQAVHKKHCLEKTLKEKVTHLNALKENREIRNQELKLRLQSFDDPEWMELVLKEKLGVTGEGELKVVFE